jgi:hypothetical protein
MDKITLTRTLRAFIQQRPGLEFGNYGDVTAYRAEARSIGKDLQQARTLLRFVELRDSITAEMILEAARSAYSGRLTIVPSYDAKTDSEVVNVDYCTGQYWPTEYRRAACSVLSSAIWAWYRDHCMPDGELVHNSETGETFKRYAGMRAGDYLRKQARNEFGRAIAARWFA